MPAFGERCKHLWLQSLHFEVVMLVEQAVNLCLCFVHAVNVRHMQTHVYHSVKKVIHPTVIN